MSIPAVGYARASTLKQDTSVKDQIKAVEEYAARCGYHIIRWYADDGISGDATRDRAQFLQMIKDAPEGDFKAILCWDQPRFGRFDPMEGNYYCYPLRQSGITLVFLDRGPVDWNTFLGQLQNSIEQHAAHDHLLKLSANVTRGHLEAALAGNVVSSAPYAYKTEGKRKEKRLVLDDANPGKALVVKRIFREYTVDGLSMHEIARRLNRDGYVSPGGVVGGWKYDSIKNILQNPNYTGDYVCCRSYGGKYRRIKNGKNHEIQPGERNPKSKRGRNPENEWVIHRDRHEALIDRETFAAAKAILAKGRTGRPKKHPDGTNPFALSCLLRCGKCGCVMYGIKSRHGGKYRFYKCGSSYDSEHRTCPGTIIREDRILHRIADYLDDEWFSLDGNALAWKAERKEIESAADLPEAFARLRDIIAPPAPKESEADLGRMKKRLKELTTKIERARGNLALLDPENVPAVQATIRQMTAEREALEAELKKKPATEQDVNTETMRALRSLYWLSIWFRVAAEEAEEPDEMKRSLECGGPVLSGALTDPGLRRFLRVIESIKVHTRIEGEGSRKRHLFERGEIILKTAPVVRDPSSRVLWVRGPQLP